ncbi:MAG: Holliday junction branch migration protein RuvA [Ignavibacteriales bacterium]
MFAFVKGTIEAIARDYMVIENNGVGFKVHSALSTLEKIITGKEAKVYTYMHVREDNISLFGFLTQEELRVFELLISVSGIGPKAAISVLSGLSPSKFSLAVITNDTAALKSISGIGLKTAQRIILELKDKVKSEDGIEVVEGSPDIGGKKLEAMSALQVLGYSANDALRVLNQIDVENAAIEDIIKQALKNFSR